MHNEVASLAKMVGFEFLAVSSNELGIKISAKKPKFATNQDGPAKIKRKPKGEQLAIEQNPWANLQNNNENAEMINEDELLNKD